MACVFLDCDSTLVSVEGIDELARHAGCFDEVAALTMSSMAGQISVREGMQQRFDLVRPNAAELTQLGEIYCTNVTTGAKEAIDALQAAGHGVGIISGGAAPAVEQLGSYLGLAAHQVHALGVRLAPDGSYLGLVEDSKLLEDEGKAQLCQQLCYTGVAVMVGDGMTDAAVTAHGIKFIQFAGVIDRAAVSALAQTRLTEASLAGLPELVEQVLAT